MSRFPTALFVAFVLFAVNANADQGVVIKRKPGLWEVSASVAGRGDGGTIKQCTDHAADAKMMQMMSQAQDGTCTVNKITEIDGGYALHSECSMSGSKVTSKGEFKGDFDAEYNGEVKTTFEPALFGMGESVTTFKAKYAGPCPADMKVGDMLMPNGMKMNVEQAKESAKRAADMMNNPEVKKLLTGALKPEQLQEAVRQQLESVQ
jgi:hypothetical protein